MTDLIDGVTIDEEGEGRGVFSVDGGTVEVDVVEGRVRVLPSAQLGRPQGLLCREKREITMHTLYTGAGG